ncbi:sugar ABC transporter ATP-binding protein [Demequina zhanjiangensis]|uniref:Sugar ABC transporter ATP-binding protein n=1 Tax=Demequina zhanjiangensis TaxID=3051659 RepID=A0ABT8G1F7_9MICO|nr:sugar ABC transporter ATP-binding protein [Demequina sp. SYSU T00b26]MDN4472958.1 sugar ABC transporter ATP-binding protein [Demequina sp. SYSU T00b26]
MDQASPLLQVTGATVRFGADAVLRRVDLNLYPGEVHSLMGENGAGKSTLVKAITGAVPWTEGRMTLAGRDVQIASTEHAIGLGISTVYQEIDLLPNLSIAENVCLGREPRRLGVIDRAAMRRRAREVLEGLGLEVDTSALLGSQSVAVQQLVAIARAISTDCRVLILDEPTSSLDLDEVAELFRIIRELKARGVAILFISHFLDQVYEICDRITVLRDGELVGEYLTDELLRVDLVQKMLGHEGAPLRARDRETPERASGEALVSGRGISAGGVVEADVDLGAGEVLGVAGLLGSGRTSLARALTGVTRLDSGIIRIEGETTDLESPRTAMSLGVVYSSENRRRDGIVAEMSVLDNITLGLQAERGIIRRLPPAHRRELAMSWVDALDIRPADVDRPAGTLSGGNQQKVLLARLLALAPRVLVLDEPTRGIDVGTKVEIQNLVGEMALNGVSVVFISAELEEVLSVGDRVVVLRDGRIVDTVDASSLTTDGLLALVARPDESEV